MKFFKLFIVSLALFTAATAVNAQSVDSNSQSSAGSNSGSTSQLSLTQNTSGQMEYGGHYSITSKGQVPVSVVGYGSFSQNSCYASVGAGATTRLFSFVYNGPKADINCQHVVSGDAFGRATQLAMQVHAPEMAMKSLSMVFFKYCTSDEDTKQACITMGLVEDTGKVRREHGDNVAVVRPVSVLPEGADRMAAAMGIPPSELVKARREAGVPIPHRDETWTNKSYVQPTTGNDQASVTDKPAGLWAQEPWVRAAAAAH